MKLARRRFLRAAAGAVTLPAVTRIAWALDYPLRPVRVLVGFAAAGPTDIVARLAGHWLSQRLDRQFVIENRPGASSNIATEAVVRAALPEVPTVGEFVAGYEASSFFGVGAPKGTPAEIVSKLNSAINAGLADRQLKERLADLGGDPMPMSPAEFARLIVDETEKWGKVIRTANMKPE
jgi:tripartite-type tricarboxylate transporter receptor subunit TctC